MAITKISTRDMTRDDWLRHRSQTIGGSDAAAILGLNNWSSPYSVWAEKTGILPIKEDNEAMRQGRDLEQYVAERFCEKTGKKVRRINAIISNDMYPFAHANIDRDIIGEDAGLECKTTSVMNLRQFRNGEYPANYYVQCVHYMAVTGAQKWYLAVLVLGRDFMVYEIQRDESEITALMQAEIEFWKLVKNNTPPPADGSRATSEAVSAVFPAAHEDTVDLFGVDTIVQSYLDAKERRNLIDTEIDEYENKIKINLGEAEYGITNIAKISWKNQTRTSFDKELFSLHYPDIDLSKFQKKTQSRVFKVTKFKEA